MDVTDFEASALTSESARTHRGETALVLEFGERIDLVHELRQLRAREELLHRSGDWTWVDELPRDDGLDIAGTHAVLDVSDHTIESDTELVLDEFAHGAHAAIAEVVDIVRLAFRIIIEADDFADDENEVVDIQNAVFFLVGTIDFEPLIEPIAADGAEVIALEIEEHAVDHLFGVLLGGEVARTETLVDFAIGFALIGGAIFGEGRLDIVYVALVDIDERLADLFFHHAERFEERRHGQFTLAVDLHREDAVKVGLDLEPSTAVRDDFRTEELLALLILHGEEHSWGADELGNDDTLDTIDDERTAFGHEGNFAEIDLLLLHFARLLHEENCLRAERRLVGDILVFRDARRVFRLVEVVARQGELQVLAREVTNRIDFVEEFLEAFLPEPIIGGRLHLDEVRQGHGDTVLEEPTLLQ